MPPAKPKKIESPSGLTFHDNDWVIPRIKKPEFRALDWVKSHQAELEKKAGLHPDFLDACGKANANPASEFRELALKLVNPQGDEFWQNFAKTFEHSVAKQLELKIPSLANQSSETVCENTLFSSFARMIKKPLVVAI